jgi:hypothetical protein
MKTPSIARATAARFREAARSGHASACCSRRATTFSSPTPAVRPINGAAGFRVPFCYRKLSATAACGDKTLNVMLSSI